jgi:outer membrane protein assembly factor BamA
MRACLLIAALLAVGGNAGIVAAPDTGAPRPVAASAPDTTPPREVPASAPDTADRALAKAMASGRLRAFREAGGRLVEGPVFLLGDILVRGLPRFTAAQLGIAEYGGEPATGENFNAIADRIRSYLLDHGHPFATIAIDFEAREEKPVADLAIAIIGGDGFKFGGLKHSGSRILPDVLDRLSLLRYGETFSESRLRSAAGKLSRTGYFETVVPGKPFRDSTRNLLYPTLVLNDLKGNRLSGILGYDSEKDGGDGINGYLDIHLINLRGTARDLDFTFDSKSTGENTASREARFAYTEPWLLATKVGARIDLRASIEDSVYDERSAELTLFQDLDFHSRYLVALAVQTNHDFPTGTRTDADIAGLGFQYDARDRVPSPLEGAKFSLRLNGVHRDLGDSAYFLVQSINELALWKNLGRWVGHVLVSGSGNWPLEGRSNRGELYALGGANTIRGFREREFLTDLFVYGNFELQFLLAPKSRASLFAVPGLINHLGGEVHWQRVIGYGAGLESGAKDWTFGISYALNPDRNVGDGFVHLRVTNNF